MPAAMTYSYDCLNQNSDVKNLRDFYEEIDGFFTNIITSEIEVTDYQETLYGEKYLKEAQKSKGFVVDYNKKLNDKLNRILSDLLSVRVNPSNLQYKIYLIKDDSEINAYTIGGKIFINTAIVNRCNSDDQLYCIIGHEIGHNELGHIKSSLKQSIASDKYWGELSSSFLKARGLITASFNQKNELEADYYGINLAWKLGYNLCSIKSFWDEMAKNEKYYFMKDLLSTHPYSAERSRCLLNHIYNNFKIICN